MYVYNNVYKTNLCKPKLYAIKRNMNKTSRLDEIQGQVF